MIWSRDLVAVQKIFLNFVDDGVGGCQVLGDWSSGPEESSRRGPAKSNTSWRRVTRHFLL
jgi:hypothetical protein